MIITLDGLTLPSDLIWFDEYDHSPVKQTITTAVDGSLIVESAAQLAGRPLTLKGGIDYGWIDRATLELLRLKQAQPGLIMALLHLGITYSLIFRQPAINASPVIDFNTPDPVDWYVVTLTFIKLS